MTTQMAFDITSKNIKIGDYQAFQETVTNIISDLNTQINKKDLDNILTGKQVLTREIIKNQQAPEEFTKRCIIEPLLSFLGYKNLGGKTEAGEVLGEKKREVDYKLPVNNDMILLEAELLNHDLTAKGHGVAQVTEWLSYKTVETDYGVATNGFEWILLKFDDNLKKVRILKTVNLLPLFRQKSGFSTLDKETNIETVFSEFYSTFAFCNIIIFLREIDKILVEKREEVSKQFYNKYIELVFGITKVTKEKIEKCNYYLLNAIKTPGLDTQETEKRKFVVTFMNRVLFIKFLEDKQLAPPHLLKQLYKRYTNQTPPASFYKTYMTPLFYNVLNTALLVREKNVKNIDLFQNIPYLNGGLFRENIKDEKLYDIENDILEKIIAFMEEYDFTLSTTATTLDNGSKKGILDPDILGYVFEKTINFLTGEGTDRKKMLGAYYTPDEITTYISKNTIHPFLLEKIREHLKKKGWKDNNLQYNTLEEMLTKPPSKNRNIWEEILNNIINKITVLDPACGSGHFLTSTLKELLYIKETIYHIMEEKNYDRYHLKWEIIANNLFGVDIEGAAVEIAKLRLWLSLIEDLEKEERGKIETLPNIEFNIREGNSLIGWLNEDLKDVSIETCYDEYMEAILDGLKLNYMNNPIIRQKIEEAEKILRKEYARAETYVEAYSILHDIYPPQTGEGAVLLHKMIEGIRKKIYLPVTSAYVRYLGKQGIKNVDVSVAEKRSVFHWKVDFGFILDNGDFNIIIGNPPYGNILKDDEKSIVKKEYTCTGSSNIAENFLERVTFLGSSETRIGFIVPKSIAFYVIWKQIRSLYLKKQLTHICDVGIGFVGVNYEEIITITKNTLIKGGEKNNVNIHVGYPLKRPHRKDIRFVGCVDQEDMVKHSVFIFRPINNIEKNILETVDKNSVKLSTFYREAFRSIYISDGEKKKLKKGNVVFVDKVPKVKKYCIIDYLMVELEGTKRLEKAKKIMVPRIFFKVLRGKHIVAYPDIKGKLLTTEKLANIILKDPTNNKILALTAIINTPIPSFYIEKLLFSETTETSRVMDDAYVGKIPICKFNEMEEEVLSRLAEYMIFANQINYDYPKKYDLKEKIDFFNELCNTITYDLYLQDGVNIKTIQNIKESLESIEYDKWYDIKFGDEKDEKTLNVLIKKNIEIINRAYQKLYSNKEITERINETNADKNVQIIKSFFSAHPDAKKEGIAL